MDFEVDGRVYWAREVADDLVDGGVTPHDGPAHLVSQPGCHSLNIGLRPIGNKLSDDVYSR